MATGTPAGACCGAAGAPPATPPELSAAQSALFAALDPTRAQAVDTLAAAADIGVDVAVAGLLELELGGWAVRAAGGGYRRGGS